MRDIKNLLQISIVVCLLIIAGLLFSIYRKIDSRPNPQAPAATATVPTPAQTAPAAAGAPASPTESPAAATASPGAQPATQPTPKSSAPASAAKSKTAVGAAKSELPPAPSLIPSRDAPLPASAAAPNIPASTFASADNNTQPPAAQPPYNPPAAAAAAGAPQPRMVTLPAGQSFTVRLLDRIDSDRNHTGDTFQCALDEPLWADGVNIANRGSMVVGRLVEAKQAGRVAGKAEVTLAVDRLMTISGEQQIDTEVTRKQSPSGRGKDATKVGVLTGLGAMIGALAGHGKGAAIGAGAGATAGTADVLFTRGKPIKLEPETRLTFRLRSSLTIAVDPYANPTRQPPTDRPLLLRRDPD